MSMLPLLCSPYSPTANVGTTSPSDLNAKSVHEFPAASAPLNAASLESISAIVFGCEPFSLMQNLASNSDCDSRCFHLATASGIASPSVRLTAWVAIGYHAT